ncbi:MAG TPA: hypothetical protein VGK02_12395 [Candidatus Aquicultor sp.]|jgi:hypothetical protein
MDSNLLTAVIFGVVSLIALFLMVRLVIAFIKEREPAAEAAQDELLASPVTGNEQTGEAEPAGSSTLGMVTIIEPASAVEEPAAAAEEPVATKPAGKNQILDVEGTSNDVAVDGGEPENDTAQQAEDEGKAADISGIEAVLSKYLDEDEKS